MRKSTYKNENIYDTSEDSDFEINESIPHLRKRRFSEYEGDRIEFQPKDGAKDALGYSLSISEILIQIFSFCKVNLESLQSLSETEREIVYTIINHKISNNQIDSLETFRDYLDHEQRCILSTIHLKNSKSKLLQRLLNKKHELTGFAEFAKGGKTTFTQFVKCPDRVARMIECLDFSEDAFKLVDKMKREVRSKFEQKFANIELKYAQDHAKARPNKDKRDFFQVFLKNLKLSKSRGKQKNERSLPLFKNFNNLPILLYDLKALRFDLIDETEKYSQQ